MLGDDHAPLVANVGRLTCIAIFLVTFPLLCHPLFPSFTRSGRDRSKLSTKQAPRPTEPAHVDPLQQGQVPRRLLGGLSS